MFATLVLFANTIFFLLGFHAVSTKRMPLFFFFFAINCLAWIFR